MKWMLRKPAWAVLLCLAAAGAFYATVTLANPQAGGPPPHRPPGPSHDNALEAWLGMSPEQADEVRNADPKFHQDMRRLEQELSIERTKLAILIEADEFDENAVREQFQTVGKKHLAIHQRLADHVVAVRPLLNPEQRTRFLDLLANHFRGGPKPAGPHPGPGRGGPGQPPPPHGGPGGHGHGGPPPRGCPHGMPPCGPPPGPPQGQLPPTSPQ